jgi:large exoprotein involved in heme utilization and adhesion
MVVDGQISFLPLFCSSDNISDKSNAGNIDINVLESITLDGRSTQGSFSGINTSVLPTAEGNAGDIEITTNRLSLTNEWWQH